MEEDSEGFLYPVVAAEDCINCKLCEKVCPVLNRYPAKEEPLKCYLGKTTDEIIRSHSSSGGIFAEVANFVIQKGELFSALGLMITGMPFTTILNRRVDLKLFMAANMFRQIQEKLTL